MVGRYGMDDNNKVLSQERKSTRYNHIPHLITTKFEKDFVFSFRWNERTFYRFDGTSALGPSNPRCRWCVYEIRCVINILPNLITNLNHFLAGCFCSRVARNLYRIFTKFLILWHFEFCCWLFWKNVNISILWPGVIIRVAGCIIELDVESLLLHFW